jgi:hypothetical protein
MTRQPKRVVLVTVFGALLGSGATVHAQGAAQPEGSSPGAASALPPSAEPAQPAPTPPGYNPAPAYGAPPAYGYPPPAAYGPPPGYYYPPQQPAYYPPQVMGTPPGFQTHDGFFLRLNPGLGFLNAKYSYGGTDTTISGSGLALSLAAGGAITPNLVIYGEFVATSALDPTVKTGSVSGTWSGDVSLIGIGPGIAYYLEPSNVYFSGTLAFSQVTRSVDSSSSDSNRSTSLTDMGLGLALTVGKEWWVSQNWGLGFAGMFHAASMKVKNVDDTRMSAVGISILFSATYN